MMKRSINLLLAALLMSALAACDDDNILDPGSDADAQSTELALSVDQDLTDAMVTDVEASIDALAGPAPSSGYAAPTQGAVFSTVPDPGVLEQARELLRQAREKFRLAREAWERGDTELAAELAKEGRLLVAEAIYLVFGQDGIERLKERVDLIISWLEERVDGEESDLLARIRELRDQAQEFCDQDLPIDAGERLLLAIQIAGRERADHRREELEAHARFSIFMAHSSLELAFEVVGDDMTEEQIYVLRYAQHVLEHAEEAFSMGRYRVSLHLAREVIGLTLLAVLQEPGPDRSKVLFMIGLSERAIEAMEAAIEGQDLEPFVAALAERAKALQLRGVVIADTNPREAVHILWFASSMAYGVIRLVTAA